MKAPTAGFNIPPQAGSSDIGASGRGMPKWSWPPSQLLVMSTLYPTPIPQSNPPRVTYDVTYGRLILSPLHR